MSDIEELLARIDEFHITDRGLVNARERVRQSPQPDAVEALCRAAAKYFGGMARESERDIEDIDRKLDDLYQRQYNLQAERGVAQRRGEMAQVVLRALNAVSERSQS